MCERSDILNSGALVDLWWSGCILGSLHMALHVGSGQNHSVACGWEEIFLKKSRTVSVQ